MIIYLLTTAVAICFLLFRFNKRRPGPIPLPWIGNYFNIYFSKLPLPELVTLWGQRYGGLFYLYFGSERRLFITDPDLAYEALIVQPAVFSGRRQVFPDETEPSNIAFLPLNDEHRIKKKVTCAALKMVTDEVDIGQKCDKLVEQWLTEVDISGPFDPMDGLLRLCVRYSLDRILGVDGSHRVPGDEFYNELVSNLHTWWRDVELNLMTENERSRMIPWFKSAPAFPIDEIVATLEVLVRRSHKIYMENGDIPACLLDEYIKRFYANENEEHERYFHWKKLKFLLSDMAAGSTTALAGSLYWLVFYLALRPDVQERVRDEIQSRGQEPRTKSTLPYCWAVVNEVMRCRPVMAFGLVHTVTRDTRLGPHYILKDTNVTFAYQSLNTSPKYWSPNFDPDRFLREDIEKYPMTFGKGPRACPGEHFAKTFVFNILISMMRKREFEFAENETFADESRCRGFSALQYPKPFRVNFQTF